ncbi:UNVERIFIED_CONTAM: hypothetical protein GTU68_010444 [Idotea baltica]|nr:hypothetical protein [Idotea baltica]
MQVGFIHGVMNTDNMTVSGETIDYGPCAFMDAYNPETVFSSIDTGGRYAYGQQPNVAQWNLARLAETLIELFDTPEIAIEQLTERINTFPERYRRYWLDGMRAKLGLATERDRDLDLINDFLELLTRQKVDYTLAMRRLSDALFSDPESFDTWFELWQTRKMQDDLSASERASAMDRVNPIYIPRNHKVEEALAAASENDDMAPFKRMLEVLSNPFVEQNGAEEFAKPAPPEFEGYQTFCGT